MEQPKNLTILVVDDDDGHRELVRRNLRRGGVTNPIVCLMNGVDALDYVFRRGSHAERRADTELLMLLDVNMPGINGIEVLRSIKADPKTRRIPVIMLTTTDDPREVDECYALGCSVYVTKPIEPTAFIDAINKLGMFISIVRAPRVLIGTGEL